MVNGVVLVVVFGIVFSVPIVPLVEDTTTGIMALVQQLVEVHLIGYMEHIMEPNLGATITMFIHMLLLSLVVCMALYMLAMEQWVVAGTFTAMAHIPQSVVDIGVGHMVVMISSVVEFHSMHMLILLHLVVVLIITHMQ